MGANNVNSVSILGCGWFGVALGKSLLEDGYDVQGSGRESLEISHISQSFIKPVWIDVRARSLLYFDSQFWQSDVVVVGIPPIRNAGVEEVFPRRMQMVIDELVRKGVKRVILLSSTIVYPNNCEIVREDDIRPGSKPSGVAWSLAETLFRNEKSFTTTIVRLAGIIGEGRDPGVFTMQRHIRKPGNVPVNIIHMDDAVGVVKELIKNDQGNETFNACSAKHPTRQELYEAAGLSKSGAMPDFLMLDEPPFKIVNSDKLREKTGYQFLYDDPLVGIKELYQESSNL